MRKELSFAVIAVIGLTLGCAGPVTQERKPGSEQRRFSAEDDTLAAPVSLPISVLALLAQDSGVQQALKAENLSTDELPASWFSASEVHLNGTAERCLVVVGQEYLLGANVTTFWIFHPTNDQQQFELIFNAPAHDLEITETQSRGYYDLQALSASATQVFTSTFRFDGSRYQLSSSTSEPIR